jgi:4-hydroxythreonine-4-phosphate dehydrogenase
MPFRRVSVDHGTAFDLWGKNKANYAGMLYLMEEIKNWK